MARDQEEAGQGEFHGTSDWLVPVQPALSHAFADQGTPAHVVQLMEVDGDVDPKMKISNDYVVQLPSPNCNDELILTPPLAPEELHRFSKRNLQGMQEHVEAKAMKLASKKNLEGLQQGGDAEELRAGADAVRANTMQLMNMCDAARQSITGE
ncbi:uncharacterized protein [Aegilops tauschii subsp. strangulata]|uniref:uncharacterized protein n=1 Tax=Aegilops tauschii subsp. strangulata TaxID=200361 RepID=UPI001ABCB454|nr:uncharacterized protein LOC109775777 [Aegilops tauschii subsp. strangulata]